MPVGHSNALYYPFIDIQNEAWLRHAVLFWESLSTIVPESIAQPYEHSFTRELAEAGIVRATHINSKAKEVEELGDAVLEYLTDPAATNVLLPTSADQGTRLHNEKLPDEISRLARMYPEKLPSFIRMRVNQLVDRDGFVRVDDRFSDYYMTLLSVKIAKRLGLSVITDSTPANALVVSVIKGIPTRTLSLPSGRSPDRCLLARPPTNATTNPRSIFS